MERRSWDRQARKVFRPAMIEAEGLRSVVILRDLSTAGAGLKVVGRSAPLLAGQDITLDWGSHPVAGTVKWARDDRIGLEFEDQVDIASLSLRPVRVPLKIPASLYVRGQEHDCEIVNLSQHGLGVASDVDIAEGSLASLNSSGLDLQSLSMRWSDDHRQGMSMSSSLSIPAFSAIVDRISQRSAAPA